MANKYTSSFEQTSYIYLVTYHFYMTQHDHTFILTKQMLLSCILQNVSCLAQSKYTLQLIHSQHKSENNWAHYRYLIWYSPYDHLSKICLIVNITWAKTVTSIHRSKMKRDAWLNAVFLNEERHLSEMLSFYSKKTVFHSGVSLHFRATNEHYGFGAI